MDDTYRSQFRLPYGTYEKLKAEADKAGRSVNAELVVRLEQTLNPGTNDSDLRTIFDILDRLSMRNPHLRYSFSVSNGDEDDERNATRMTRATPEMFAEQPAAKSAEPAPASSAAKRRKLRGGT